MTRTLCDPLFLWSYKTLIYLPITSLCSGKYEVEISPTTPQTHKTTSQYSKRRRVTIAEKYAPCCWSSSSSTFVYSVSPLLSSSERRFESPKYILLLFQVHCFAFFSWFTVKMQLLSVSTCFSTHFSVQSFDFSRFLCFLSFVSKLISQYRISLILSIFLLPVLGEDIGWYAWPQIWRLKTNWWMKLKDLLISDCAGFLGIVTLNLLRNFLNFFDYNNTFFLDLWSSSMTEIMEIQAENPTFHVLFIPGNPGFMKSIIMLKTLVHAHIYYIWLLHTLACNFQELFHFTRTFWNLYTSFLMAMHLYLVWQLETLQFSSLFSLFMNLVWFYCSLMVDWFVLFL